MKKGRVIKTFIVHSLTFAFMLAGAFAEVLSVRPFGRGMHLAVLLAGGSPVASAYFLAASIIAAPDLLPFASAAGSAVAGAAAGFIISACARIKRKKLWRYIVHMTLQPALTVLLEYFCGATLFAAVLTAALATLSGVVAAFGVPLLAGKDISCPGALRSAGAAALLIMLFAGLGSADIYGFRISYLAFAFLVPLTGKCRSAQTGLLAGLVAATGVGVTGDVYAFAALAAAALGCRAFYGGVRVLPALGLLLGWAACAYFFGESIPPVAEHIALAAGAALFVVLPRRAVDALSSYFRAPEALTAAAAASGMGRLLPERLVRASEALGEMSALLSSGGGAEYAADCISDALSGVCASCEKRDECRVRGEMRAYALDYASGGSALKSAALGEPCISGGKLLRLASEVMREVRGRAETAEREKQNAAGYAKRLDSLRRLVGKMATEISGYYRFDTRLSEKLRRDLPETGVPCGGGLVTAERRGIALVPRKADAAAVERGISRVLGRVRLDRTDDVTPIWKAVSFSPAPALDVVYACASRPKDGNTVSGDGWSVIGFGTTALISLCDGSGSGRGAASLTRTALSVIEDQFRAGFDAGETVESVNSFLASRPGEEFGALDAVGIDLGCGNADIIKAGSPPTLVMHGDTVSVVRGSSLPAGALETAAYSLARRRLEEGDYIVLVTDGVTDVVRDLPETVAACVSPNVRKMADGILAAASAGGCRDDMSVLVARIVNAEDTAAHANG